MIKIRIKNYDNEIDVRFPISENELYIRHLRTCFFSVTR